MTRLAFTGDLHVDQYGSRIDPATGLNARLVDYLNTVRFVATDAKARGAAALVVGGDFCERKHVNSWIAGKIGEALLPGPDRQIFVEGNHDGSIGGESIVTVLGRMRPDWVGYHYPGVALVDDVAIVSIPHLDGRWLRTQAGFETAAPQDVNRALAEQYLVLARALYAQVAELDVAARILVVHQGLSGGAMSEAQAAFLGDRSLVVDSAALASIGWTAVIASHFHRAQELSDEPPVLYTGSVERVDFAEEHEDKSYLVVDVERDGTTGIPVVAWTRIPTPARRYVTLHSLDPVETGDVDLNGAIVRLLDVDPDGDPALLRSTLESYGAFEVTEIRKLRPETEATGGMAEDLAPEAALEAYFADDPEGEALVARGREILAEVGS